MHTKPSVPASEARSEPKASEVNTVVSAGGLVIRRTGAGIEAALAEQDDRNSRSRTIRLPKGHLAAGESLAEAALREVAEETGLAARILAPLGEVSYDFTERKSGERIAKVVHYFLMAWQAGEARPADGEMAAVFWCALAGAGPRLTFASEREVVARARALLESADSPAF